MIETSDSILCNENPRSMDSTLPIRSISSTMLAPGSIVYPKRLAVTSCPFLPSEQGAVEASQSSPIVICLREAGFLWGNCILGLLKRCRKEPQKSCVMRKVHSELIPVMPCMFMFFMGCNRNSNIDLARIDEVDVWCQNWMIPHSISYEKLLLGELQKILSRSKLDRIGEKLRDLEERSSDYSFEKPWLVAKVVDKNGKCAELRAAYDELQFDGVHYKFDKKLLNLLIYWSGSGCTYFPGDGLTTEINAKNTMIDFDPFEGDWSETIP